MQAVSAHNHSPLPDSYHCRKKIVPLLTVLVGGHSERSLSYLPMVYILKVAVLMAQPCPGPGVKEAMQQWPQAGMFMESESQMRRPTQQLQQRVEFNGHSKGYRTLFSAQSKLPWVRDTARCPQTPGSTKGGPAPKLQLCTREPTLLDPGQD